MGFSSETSSPESSHCIVIEDDGKVAYAYLLEGENIVADVWLYNRATAPVEPEWNDPDKIPFANPRDYVKDEPFAPIESEQEFEVRWFFANNSLQRGDIYIREKIHARLKPGSKPGWCVLAVKDGPLANILHT